MRVGNLERSFVVCPPIDLAHVEQHFRTYWGRRYDRFFVRLIWAQMLSRWQHFPETAPAQIPKRPRRLREIDELVIAPSGGFSSADDYYRKTSPGPKMASIKQPLTIVFSEDDPVVPVEPLFDTFRSSSIETVTTHHGGHLGFLAGRHDDPDFRWLDWRIIEWLAAGRTERKVEGGTNSFTNHAGELGRRHPHAASAQPASAKPTSAQSASAQPSAATQPAR
jgi:predicted alpha/beta-fold hydrolase